MSNFSVMVKNVLKEHNIVLSEDSIEDLKKQIKYLEDEIARNELADNFYYTNGRYDSDSAQLRELKNKLNELERASRTPAENERLDAEERERREKEKKAAADYNKSLYDVPEKFHFNEGDKIKNRETGEIYVVDEVTKKWDSHGENYPKMTPYYHYHITCLDPNAKDNFGRPKSYYTGEVIHRGYDLYEE